MLTQEQRTMMAENVAHIRENMAAAAREAGRDPADILLCAACKTRTVETVRESAALPIDLFGENHVQELVEKTDAGAYLGKPGHFIGHLQTNKIKKVLGRAALIQSVDSEHLLLALEAAAAKADGEVAAFLNVHRRPGLNHGVGRLAGDAGKERMGHTLLFKQGRQSCHMPLANHGLTGNNERLFAQRAKGRRSLLEGAAADEGFLWDAKQMCHINHPFMCEKTSTRKDAG